MCLPVVTPASRLLPKWLYAVHDQCKVSKFHFSAKAAISQAASTSTDATTKSEDDKYSVPASSLERTLKDVEENIKNEKNKLKGKATVDSSSSIASKPSIKTKPTGTPEYNPTPITELKKQKGHCILGRSKYDLALLEKPSSEQEYDPCSNFATSFKGTATTVDVPEYAPNIHGTKRTANDDGESESPVAKIPKFVSVEYTPAVAEASFSDEEPPGDKESWFSEEDSVKDNTSVSDIGDNNSDVQDNVVDSVSDPSGEKQVSKTEEKDKSKDALPFEFTSEGFIKVSDVKSSKAETKPKKKTSENTKIENEKGKEENKVVGESVKKDEKKNIFSLFMAAAESVLSKASAEDKLELKSAIDEIKGSKNSERRDSTEKKNKNKTETSSSSSSNKVVNKIGTLESHSKSSKSSESKSSCNSEKVKSSDSLEKIDSHKRSGLKDKENRKSHLIKDTKEKVKSDDSDKLRHLNHKSKNDGDKPLHKNHKSESTDKKSEKSHKNVKVDSSTSSHLNHHKSKSTKDSASHSRHKLKDGDKKSSSLKHHKSDKHSAKSDKSDSKKYSDVKNSKQAGHSRENTKHSDKTITLEDSKSVKTSNNKPTLTPKRRKSSEKVKRLVKTRKIVDLNVDLFGADSDSETKDKDDSAKSDSAKGHKKSETDTDINHYDSDVDLDNLDLDQTDPDAENEFSDLEKYFSEEDPFDECLRIFNEERPSTSAGSEKKVRICIYLQVHMYILVS